MNYQYFKNIGHLFETHFWRLFYGMPDAGMKIYGITGTNGKTTTSFILANILEQAYGKGTVGMLTTVAFRIGEVEEINKSKMTTLQSKRLFQYLSRMKKSGVTHVVLEVTSHALDQYRLAGITFDGAIILNIAREHLDYHKTMEQYAAAKEKITALVKNGAPLIGKQDDEYVRPMMDRAEKSGVRVVRMTQEIIGETTTPLAGSINKENAAAASLLANAVGVSEEQIKAGVAGVEKVPGRMERLTPSNSPLLRGRDFTIIIDYAVTPDALERLYADAKKEIQCLPAGRQGKILATLSAAGNRDRGKRPDMAKVVATYADYIVVTREDPWTEPEEQIFNDLEKGFEGTSVRWERIVDRKEALEKLLQTARPGDIVVVTGKGAERGMGIGKEVVPWNEREVIGGILRSL